MIDLNDQLAQNYLADCKEHLAAVEADLFALQMTGAQNHEARLSRVIRSVHSIWGGASFFDLDRVRELSAKMELALVALRASNEGVELPQTRILLSAVEELGELLRFPEQSNGVDIWEMMEALDPLIATSDAARTHEPAAEAAPEAGKPLRILLAEDDLACRLLLQSFLGRYGKCDAVVNGQEAVDAFRMASDGGELYGLICMDIMMPRMDGREAVRQIRGIEEAKGVYSSSGVKIIMTTTVDDVKEVILCFQELCDAYLMKPIDLGKLLKQMQGLQVIAG